MIQQLINLKMIDFTEYNMLQEAANRQLIFGIWIDLEDIPLSSVNSGYLYYWNLLTFSLKSLPG
jgi:hypothetical protein